MTATLLDQLQVALGDSYRVERELPAGGMSRLFLATERSLERRVVVKLLPPDLESAVSAARFQREMLVTAKLQHPHILPMLAAGARDGLAWYVMPYVRGESLRARLKREKQLPVDEGVRIAIQVAGALDYAHRQGIVHRDVKPENILLAEDGEAVVADFGVARAITAAVDDTLTSTGLAVGTPSYMSPEQASAEHDIDGRSDIYSLGCVLYEMLAGEPPFTGPNAHAVIARVLTERPRPLRTVREAVPERVETALQKALAKVAADRWYTARRFAEALEGRATTPRPEPEVGAPGSRVAAEPWRLRAWRGHWLPPGLLALALAAGAGIGAAVWSWGKLLRTPAPIPVTFTLSAPSADAQLASQYQEVAISPDGRAVVYSGRGGLGLRLYVRRIDELHPRALEGTEGARGPFFSPDGRWIAFSVSVGGKAKVRKIPVDGGTVMDIADRPAGDVHRDGDWSPNDVIVFSAHSDDGAAPGLFRVAGAGGVAKRLTAPDTAKGEVEHMSPRLLADGSTVIFAITRRSVGTRLAVGSLETGEYTVLDLLGRRALGVFDGRLLYLRSYERSNDLLAVPFDTRRRSVKGEAVPVLAGVGGASVAGNGTLVYTTGSSHRTVVLVDQRGAASPLIAEPRPYANPRLSPDGKWVAVDSDDNHIWLYEIASGTLTRLTSEGINHGAEWTPDGKRVVFHSFHSSRQGQQRKGGLWWQPADGSRPAEQLVDSAADPHLGIVSPDGHWLLYSIGLSRQRHDFAIMGLDGDRQPRPFLVDRFDKWAPRFSPDGRWVAYVSNESGRQEVYVRPFPGPGGRVQVSATGGGEPVWSPDGRRLFYRNGRQMIAATLTTAPTFAVTAREVLFTGDYHAASGGQHASFDVTRDGKQFLMVKPAGDAQLVVVLNWLAELQALATGGRR
jgi:Tol biopolymer transport system component